MIDPTVRSKALGECAKLARTLAAEAMGLAGAMDRDADPDGTAFSLRSLKATIAQLARQAGELGVRVPLYRIVTGVEFLPPTPGALPCAYLHAPPGSCLITALSDRSRRVLCVPASNPALSAAVALEAARAGKLGLGIEPGPDDDRV